MSTARLTSHFSVLCSICKRRIEIKALEKRGPGRKAELGVDTHRDRRARRVTAVCCSQCMIHEK